MKNFKKNLFLVIITCFGINVFGQCVAPPNNLISWWAAEDNANDSEGSNHGTPNGVSYATGAVNKAFLFDGVDDLVVVSSNNNLDITGDITVEFWALQTVFNLENMAVCKGAKNEPTVFSMYFSGATFNCAFQDTDETIVELGGPSFEDFQWHHYAYVRQGNQHIIYADGFDFGWVPFTNPPASSSGLPLTIGAQYDNQNDDYVSFFGGQIDEVTVYNRALSEIEIQDIYNAGSNGKCSETLNIEEEVVLENQIRIYPNPVTHTFTLDISKSTFTTNENLELHIFDLSGRLVTKVNRINISSIKIDISNLNSGVYLYKLNGNNIEKAAGKIIKR
ncbi:LamG-like jellyroll fold domain-containing protein [uncultured Algibacter sp.]|uniref:LamG-like jellyroll fold domain-containing protein n=1 Tax=uncultured Algibacter sp. TaxID=298659 RepID=UPI00261A396F|nr:LamG-like jellyroll fold domain-containing protein [uncultured Algibacter sp.]